MKLITITALLGVGLGLTACSDKYLKEAGFERNGNNQTGTIEFKVQASGTRLEIDNNPNRRCERITKSVKLRRGCFDVDKGDSGEFTFKFKQQSDADDFYFTEFQICTWNGGATVPQRSTCGLSVKQRLDFSVVINGNPVLPDEDGRINLAASTTKLDEWVLTDLNQRDQVYFYWVDVCPEAASPGDPACLTVDPGSRNGGRR